MKKRKAKIKRLTKETKIIAELNVDGKGEGVIKSQIDFFAHMLSTFAKTGCFDLKLNIQGDLNVDQHHTVEDTGIVLGQAFKKALGNKKGINRAGFFVYPMDEALAVVAVDISGRPYLQLDAKFKRRFCGDLDTDLIEDFFQAFTSNLGANIVVRMPYGRSDHHKIEAIFKAFGRAMKTACSKDKRMLNEIPSTKGVIEK
jgi:imidazoleglycerol-phosphate dehydratase